MSSPSQIHGLQIDLDHIDPTLIGIIVDGPHYQGTNVPGEGHYVYIVAVYKVDELPYGKGKLIPVKLDDIVLTESTAVVICKYGLKYTKKETT
jgi:hypothetical protein